MAPLKICFRKLAADYCCQWSGQSWSNVVFFSTGLRKLLIPLLSFIVVLGLMFGQFVYNRAKIYIHQNSLKVVVHAFIIDQLNQVAHLYEIQVTVIYIGAILVVVTSECSVKRVFCKNLDWDIGTQCSLPRSDSTERGVWSGSSLFAWIIRILKVKRNNLKSPFRTIFPTNSLWQSFHQCWQCVDCLTGAFSLMTTRTDHLLAVVSCIRF